MPNIGATIENKERRFLMGEKTNIQWTDATISPWDGCTKVGPGCDHCYAEVIADKRFHIVKWGVGQPRKKRETFAGNAMKLERKAVREARQLKVFISMCDPFDNEVPDEWRADLFALIRATPNLTWQLLTKRIGNAKKMIDRVISTLDIGHDPAFAAWPWPNVWIGATVVNQEEADRDVPKLLDVPAAKRFVSIEPMLGPIDLKRITTKTLYPSLEAIFVRERNALYSGDNDGLDWVICGGESGKDARPMHPDWARSLRDQCASAGTSFFFKQWGEWLPDSQNPTVGGLNPWHAIKVGTKAAGNLLDGKAWQQFPDSVA